MYVENIKIMFHQKYLQKRFLMMLALLLKAGVDSWGVGVPHSPICHFLMKIAVNKYLKN